MLSNAKGSTSKLLVLFVVMGDLFVLTLLYSGLYTIWPNFNVGAIFNGSYWDMLLFNTICYIICVYRNGVTLHLRETRNRHIVSRVLRNNLKFAAVSIALITLAGYDSISTRFMVLFHVLFFVMDILWRFLARYILRAYRRRGGNSLHCVFLGINETTHEICHTMSDKESGYRMMGYFNEKPDETISTYMPYLGHPDKIIAYLEENHPHRVYCSLSSKEKNLIRQVIYWTENNFAHFFHVPQIRTYLQRRMWFGLVGDVPILSLHTMPLNNLDNRIVKRTFDLLVSGLFLITVFPFIYLIVGTIIKITSPGPIFFKQKRHGLNGKEFWCYKFRSMKVNKDADKIQATKNDPRKTKFGDFMRKTNIDELPQLINVFLGDMSLVGPRPHMLKHTEEYSALIDTYMVRHFVKPGVTGWAQVTGFRGETKELYQMEGRIKADIWYMEHWSFILDLNIIFKTFTNVIHGEKNAY